ncbi:DUF6223 family protein [Nonomuraea endophytica]|uniref:Uncharacterized protein n=1 Tax=Nonomuraea endophytica TaxID=714136 RepID=A0A7W8EM72_9ACTN|nr:DUF6223 family protein [Nonomuraea endophytica]MBB5083652.1 hypothetical protein [Nonomuraea endophytica]
MSVPPLLIATSAAVPVGAYDLTSGRLWSVIAGAIGLVGVVLGGLALARSTGRSGTGPWRKGATMALVAGLAGMVIGALVVAAAKGGPGTGYGIVGGFVDLVVGLIALILGGLAVVRARHTT